MFSADSPDTFGTGVGVAESFTPSTSSRFEAGSVLTSSTRFPASARPIAVAQAAEVLPTPPLPVKNRMRVGFRINVDMTAPFQQQPDFFCDEAASLLVEGPQQPPDLSLSALTSILEAPTPAHAASWSRDG